MQCTSELDFASTAPMRRLLYVGAGALEPAIGDLNHDADGPQFSLPLARLTAQTLQAANPDVVIFPLIGKTNDAVAVVETLVALGYHGVCLVLCPPVPRVLAIEAELRSIGHGLQISLQICPALG